MRHYLKQFTGWATALTRNPFERARIKLTLFYVGTMIIIIGVFSIALVTTIEKNISDSADDLSGGDPARREAIVRTRDGIEMLVLTIDGLVLLFVAGAGYFLAGRTLRPIRKIVDAQKRFTADASHDLRTPLAIMKTEMEVALQSGEVAYKRAIHSGLEEIETMSRLVEDLLMLARSETKPAEVEAQINYGELVEKLAKRLKYKAEEKSIILTVEIKSVGSICVHENRFMRALQNIAENAINYTPQGGVVSFTLEQNGSTWVLIVKDSGVGISVKDLEHVFERFYKASHSRNDEAGSGLGLSIAKDIIESYGGSLTLESVEGKGTKVIIEMPL